MSGSATGDTRFDPYVVTDTGLSATQVFERVNTAVWENYGPDYRIVGPEKPTAAPLDSFIRLLDSLQSIAHARFVDHVELANSPCRPDEIRIGIRHDIDTDIVGALAQARIEAERGIRANWVVLHTAPYYGAVDPESRQFRRNDSMGAVYRQLQDLGHEVSLHADPLSLYQDHGIDGSQAVITELEWLRGHGIDIAGTTAHNFRPQYGAENYEVFKGFISPDERAHPATATWVEHEGKVAPLRVLDETELGLLYEGNQIMWEKSRRVAFASVGASDQWYWLSRFDPRGKQTDLTQAQIIEEVRNLELGTDLVLVVHPEYLAVRDGPARDPIRMLDSVEYAASTLGWHAYRSNSIVAVPPDGPAQSPQSCNVANVWGMLDLPPLLRPDRRRVLIVGTENVNGASVPIGAQVQRRLAMNVLKATEAEIDVVKVAHPGFAIDRLWAWLKHIVETSRPEVVILGFDGGALDFFGRDRWPDVATTTRSKGRYLVRQGPGAVRECVYPRQKRSSESSLEALCDVYRWTIRWLRERGVATILLAESPQERSGPIGQLAAETSVPLVDPNRAIATERQRLGLTTTPIWGVTGHRVAAESLLPVVLRDLGERMPESVVTPARVIEHRPLRSAVDGHAAARREIGLLDYPTPFSGATALISGATPASSSEHADRVRDLTTTRGLDYGDGIPLADTHHRYTGERKALATTSRAVLTHDLGRDNASTGGTKSWLAEVVGQVHNGTTDHYHGLSAWGLRSLPFVASADSTHEQSSVLRSPFAGGALPDVPFALNAEDFYVAVLAVELVTSRLPPTAQPVDGSPAWKLIDTRELGDGTIGLYGNPGAEGSGLLNPPAPGGDSAVRPQSAIVAFRVAVPIAELTGAAAHNINPLRVHDALEQLNSRFALNLNTIAANRDYSLYSEAGLEDATGRLARIRDRRGTDTPLAHFARCDEVGRSASAIADDPRSPAFLDGTLTHAGVEFIAAHGPAEPDGPDPLESVYRFTDRAGRSGHMVAKTNALTATGPGTRFVPSDALDPSGLDASLDSLAAAHFDGTSWFTRASVLATYASVLERIPTIASRDGDEITLTGDVEATHLFGLSFEVENALAARVTLRGHDIDDLIRWPGRNQVSLAPCGIRWPIVAAVDPVVLGLHGGDLARSAADATWTWMPDATTPRGRLIADETGSARLTIDLGILDVAGAQVVSAKLPRRSAATAAITVRLLTASGDAFDITNADAADEGPHRLLAALWAPNWSDDSPRSRTIRSIELTLTGEPGDWVEIADLWLGRPRPLPREQPTGVLLGGNALGSKLVTVQSMTADKLWECPVEPDGLFAAPRIDPGAYLVSTEGVAPIAVQLLTDRFDLNLGTR